MDSAKGVSGPLEGLRVLDIGTALAGPFSATIMADFGAEVIKIEHPLRGDNLRHLKPWYRDSSLWWAVDGRNKKSVTVDMSNAEGQGIIKDLVRVSDVVIENYRPGTIEKWGLGYDELQKINPDVILVRVSCFGQDGPYCHRPGFDTIGAAMGGLTYLTGYPDGPPYRSGLAVTDYITGLFAALGALVAIYYRDVRKGRGQWVDVAMYECIFRFLAWTAVGYDQMRFVRNRQGNQSPSTAPLDHFMTKDGKWVVIIVAGDKVFARFARAIGREELIDDPRFATLGQRGKHTDLLNNIAGDWVAQHTLREVLDILVEGEVPVSTIYNTQDMFEDPHYQARENIVEISHPKMGNIKMQGVYPRFSLTPGSIRWAGPELGQHNEEILEGLLGNSQERLKECQGISAKNPGSSAHRGERGNGPLEGLKVLDIGTALAGPFGATLLGDLGAEVIKIELPGTGDLLRDLQPMYEDISLWWITESRNKKSITLDIRKPAGQELLKRLVAFSDVVIENYRPGTLERWGLGFEDLKSVKEDIIMIRATGFGQDGPYRMRPAYDTIGLAMGGITHLTGPNEGPPLRVGLAVCDYGTGLFSAIATMMALYYRDIRKDGQGQWVDVSLYESIFRLSEYNIPAYDKLGIIRERTGNAHPSAAPVNHFKTKDGKWLVLLAHRDSLFTRLCKSMGREDLIEDPRFNSVTKRAEHAKLIHSLVEEWIGGQTAAQVMEKLVAAQVPISPIYNIQDMFEDPHFQARKSIIEVDTPGLGRVKMQGVVPRFSLTPGRVERGGPVLGEHNQEIYEGLLGLKINEIKELEGQGVI
jgi:formyl-CoA transferase